MIDIINSLEFEMVGRILIALGLGLMIGAQRTQAGKQVGLRTYGLVSFGSAIFVVVSVLVSASFADSINFDPLRVAAQVLVGVGFLGTGVIFTRGGDVHGLTTAAGMWVAAAIGMASGFGLYVVAISATIMTVITLSLLLRVEEKYLKNETEK